MKNIIILIFVFISNLCFGQYGSLKGKFVDGSTKEPIPFANVILEKVNKQTNGCTTDFDGTFHLDSILPGKYYMKINALSHYINIVGEIIIYKNSITILYIKTGDKDKCLVQEKYEVINFKYEPIEVINRIFTTYNKHKNQQILNQTWIL